MSPELPTLLHRCTCRAEVLAQLSAMHAAAGPAALGQEPGPPAAHQQQQQQPGTAGGGADTPHSLASWPSVLSGTAAALPQASHDGYSASRHCVGLWAAAELGTQRVCRMPCACVPPALLLWGTVGNASAHC